MDFMLAAEINDLRDATASELKNLRNAVGGLMLLLVDKGICTSEEIAHYIEEYKKDDTASEKETI